MPSPYAGAPPHTTRERYEIPFRKNKKRRPITVKNKGMQRAF